MAGVATGDDPAVGVVLTQAALPEDRVHHLGQGGQV